MNRTWRLRGLHTGSVSPPVHSCGVVSWVALPPPADILYRARSAGRKSLGEEESFSRSLENMRLRPFGDHVGQSAHRLLEGFVASSCVMTCWRPLRGSSNQMSDAYLPK